MKTIVLIQNVGIMRRKILWKLLPPAALIAMGAKVLAKPASVRNDVNTPNGIESLEKVMIGGVEQSLLIRGYDASKPIVLFVHGGPGLPPFHQIKERAISRFEKDYVVVYWEQRGTGRSFSRSVKPHSMTVERLTEDLIELSEYLAERFGQPKIFLVAQSFGTVLSLKAVAQRPDLYRAFVSNVQVVEAVENERKSYEYALEMAKKNNNKKALRKLSKINVEAPEQYGHKEYLTLKRWVGMFGGWVFNGENFALRKPVNVIKQIAKTPEYSNYDVLRIITRRHFSLKHLVKNIIDVNMFEQVPEVKVPIYFLVGMYDYMTPSEITERYYNYVKAPKKELIWFEESAHRPMTEEPEKYYKEVSRILRENL